MGYFSKKELESRRDKIFAKMEDFSIAILFSGVSKIETADQNYRFSVNRNFYYLTQIDQEDSVLILYKTPTSKLIYIFTEPYDEVKEKWTGKRLKLEQVKAISYIDNVLYKNSFETKLDSLINELKESNNSLVSLYLDLESELKIGPSTTTNEFKNNFKNRYDFLNIVNIYDLIIEDRMVKSREEVEKIKQAIFATKVGLDSIYRIIRPGLYEYELSSIFEYTLKSKFNTITSFDTIAASAENATILHYTKPISLLEENKSMLFDLGAQIDYYCADISRVIPISTSFDDTTLKIYNEVLKCNELVIKSIAPGVTLAQLQEIAIKSLSKSLIDLKLIDNEKDYNKYYFHNVSHHLGLDTHDPSFRNKPLEAGNVITVEPGLYIKELGIGIRIEDDILVTAYGSINLSKDIVKNPRDIERILLSRTKYENVI